VVGTETLDESPHQRCTHVRFRNKRSREQLTNITINVAHAVLLRPLMIHAAWHFAPLDPADGPVKTAIFAMHRGAVHSREQNASSPPTQIGSLVFSFTVVCSQEACEAAKMIVVTVTEHEGIESGR